MDALPDGYYYYKNSIFTIIIRPGKNHVNIDYLFRLSNILGNEPILDILSDADLFVMDVISPKYSKIIQFLILQIFLPIFSIKLKKRLILKSAPYIMIDNALYK